MHRKLSWVQLTRSGVPSLFVLRPKAGGYTPPVFGMEYPAPTPNNKHELMRARQMYEQNYIGTQSQVDLYCRRSPELAKYLED